MFVVSEQVQFEEWIYFYSADVNGQFTVYQT